MSFNLSGKRKFFGVFALLLFMFALTAPAQAATTWYVEKVNANENTIRYAENNWPTASSPTSTDLAEFINDNNDGDGYTVKAGDTVYVKSGTYKSSKTINLNRNLKLIGSGDNMSVLDGSNSIDENEYRASVVHINSGAEVVLDGFKITHGVGSNEGIYYYGGGICIKDSSADIRNCVITSNDSQLGGGLCAVAYNGNVSLNVSNCWFDDNEAVSMDLQAIDAAGGGIYLMTLGANSINATIDKCTFTNNGTSNDVDYAPNAYGGAVALCNHIEAGIASATNFNVKITNSTFYNNSSTMYGGALSINDLSDNIVISVDVYNCTFVNNKASEGSSNEIYTNKDTDKTKIVNSIISDDNIASGDVKLENCAYPSSAKMKGAQVTTVPTVAISADWNPKPTSNDTTKVNGVTHTVFKSDLASFMGKGISNDKTPDYDQLGNARSTVKPTIGAIECRLTSLSLDITKTTFDLKHGDSLKLDDLGVIVSKDYSDGSQLPISSSDCNISWTIDVALPTGFTSKDNVLTIGTTATVGENKFNVKIKAQDKSNAVISGDKTIEITVNVSKDFKENSVDLSGTTTYTLERGKSIATGLTVKFRKVYTDNTSEDISANDYTLVWSGGSHGITIDSSTGAIKAGSDATSGDVTVKATVKYENKDYSAEKNINVTISHAPLSGISVDLSGTNSYTLKRGETKSTDLTVKVRRVYTDNTSDDLATGYTLEWSGSANGIEIDPSTGAIKAGTNAKSGEITVKVTAKYKNGDTDYKDSAEIKITVTISEASLTSLTPAIKNTTFNREQGSTLNLDDLGVTVTGNYSDQSTASVSSGDCSFEWKLKGTVTGFSIAGNVLTVENGTTVDETYDVPVTLTAKLKSNETVKGTAEVTLKITVTHELKGLTPEITTDSSFSMKRGDTKQLTATVTGQYDNGNKTLSEGDYTLEWSFEGDSAGFSITPAGLLTATNDATSRDITVKVIATSKSSNKKTSAPITKTLTITITGTEPEPEPEPVPGTVTPPTISDDSISAISAAVKSQDYSASISASGSTPMTWSVSGLPDGITADTSTTGNTLTFSGSLTREFLSNSECSVTVSVWNTAGADSRTFTLSLNTPSNQKPQIIYDKDAKYSAKQWKPYTLSFYAIGSRPLEWSATGLPDGLEMKDGVIVGVPTRAGSFSVNITATNTIGSDSISITLKVTPSDLESPIITSPEPSDGYYKKFYSHTFTAMWNHKIAENVLWSVYPDNALPDGMKVDEHSGVLSGVPKESGTFVFIINAKLDISNIDAETSKTVTLKVLDTPPSKWLYNAVGTEKILVAKYTETKGSNVYFTDIDTGANQKWQSYAKRERKDAGTSYVLFGKKKPSDGTYVGSATAQNASGKSKRSATANYPKKTILEDTVNEGDDTVYSATIPFDNKEDTANSISIGSGTKYATINDVPVADKSNIESIKFISADFNVADLNAFPKLTGIELTNCPIESLNLTIESLNLSNSNVSFEYVIIENCPNLTTLNFNDCKSLDVVICMSTPKLNSIKLTGCTALEALMIDGGTFTSLDLGGCPKLKTLDVTSCSALTKLDSLDKCTNLENLMIGYTKVDALNNLTANVKNIFANETPITNLNLTPCKDKIEFVSFTNSSLNSLNIDGCYGLKTVDLSGSKIDSLYINGRTKLTDLDISGCQNLQSLDINGCSALKNLNVRGTQLATLDLTGCTALKTLDANGCVSLDQLLEIDKCVELVTLTLNGANIANLELNTCTKLEKLDASSCKNLDNLQISNCTALTDLNISATNLGKDNLLMKVIGVAEESGTLDLSNCTKLEKFKCSNDYLSKIQVSGSALKQILCNGNSLGYLNLEGFDNLDVTSTDFSEQEIAGLNTYTKTLDLKEFVGIENTTRVSEVKGYDSEGNEIGFETPYDTATGLVEFVTYVNVVTYKYDTQFENADSEDDKKMRVTLTQKPVEDNNAKGRGCGTCNSGFSGLSGTLPLLPALLLFMKKKKR